MKHVNSISLLLLMSIAMGSCKHSSMTIDICSACPGEVVIPKLDNNIINISRPFSFDIINDSLFVLCDADNVILYDYSGHQVRRIGAPGKSKSEYNTPMVVRALDDSIYVWSSNTLRFLVYTLDGQFQTSYPYSSAIQDFLPDTSDIIVYNAGKSISNVIDVLDKRNFAITHYQESSVEHRLLSHNESSTPLSRIGNFVYFLPKDELSLYYLSDTSCCTKKIISIESPTFNVVRVDPNDNLINDRKLRSQYLKENPITLGVYSCGKEYYLFSLEGKTRVVDDDVTNEDRYFSLYKQIDGNTSVERYSYDCFGQHHLFKQHSKYVYYLRHTVQEKDEFYSLERFPLE